MPTISQMIEPVRRALTHPVDELNRWQRWFRYFIDLMRHCGRQLLDDRAEEMAAALTYRTIFSLVPLLVLGLVIFRVFGGFEDMQKTLFDFFGFTAIEYRQAEAAEASGASGASGGPGGAAAGEEAAPRPGERVTVAVPDPVQEVEEARRRQEQRALGAEPAPEAAAAEAEDRRTAQVSAQVLLTNLIVQIESLNFTSIGVAGVVLFIYAAMTLAIAVEYDFNIIFKSPTGRPWHLRVPIYWSVITLGSGMLTLSLYLSGQIVEEARDMGAWNVVLQSLSRVLAFLVSWAMLFLLYLLIPNTRVRLQPALLGSFVAALLWELGKVGFQTYVNVALPYASLYGSLGLIPLFLLWVYVSWLIILFGLELTYAEQIMRGRRSRLTRMQEECDTLLDPRWLIPVVATIGDGFRHGRATTLEQLAERMSLPVKAVSQLVEQLHKAGLLHCVDASGHDEDPGYTLAQPPEQISVPRLLELGHEISMHEQSLKSVPGREMLTRLTLAEREAAQHQTLATLLNGSGSGG